MAAPAPVPDGYQVEIFSDQDTVSAEDVVAFWTRRRVLEPAEAQRRAAEVLLVVTGPGQELVAVSTAYVAYIPRLRASLWNVRMFVAEGHRQAHLAGAMARRARDHLARLYADGEDRQSIGVFFEVQSEVLKNNQTGALLTYSRAAFIGESESGAHLRVYYFPGAPAPEPDQGSA